MAYNQPPGGYGQPPYQGQPYGQQPQYQQAPPQGYGQPPMQNQQYPPQGHYGAPPPQQQWGQPPPPGQYGAPPPGQYGAPPPNQYGGPPPQGQYGAPPQQQQWGQPPPRQGQYGAPPPGQYGAPPPGQYGAPPPQGQYGAPPPQGQYGAPPSQGQYGAPPPGQYQPPPQQQQYGPPNQPSLGYGPQQTANIDVARDVEAIRKAMKGFGTDEKALIAVLSKKDPIQINTIRTQYDQRLMRNMVNDIEKETSSYFREGLMEIARGPLVSDCYTLFNAMKGMGTKEAVLDDVLIGRSNADINAIKQEYQKLFKKSLEADLRGDLSAATEQMYMMIACARRAEDSAPVIPQEIEQAVTALQTGIGNMVSKNAALVCQTLTSKNDAQLRAIVHSYQQRFHKDLSGVLKSAFSGHMEKALLFLLARAQNRALAEAIRLEETMAGLGTKDQLLVQRVVRCHWDRNFMNAVSAEYKKKYAKDLVKRIEGETRGDLERMLVACVKP